MVAVNREGILTLMALSTLALIAFALAWPVVCVTMAFSWPRGRRSTILRLRSMLGLTIFSATVPVAGLAIFFLQHGYVAPFTSNIDCIYAAAELGKSQFPSAEQQLNIAAVLINRSSTPTLVLPPSSTQIVNGKSYYISRLDGFELNKSLYWDWPEQRVLTLEPEKPLVLYGTAPLQRDFIERRGTFGADLVTDIDVLTMSGKRFTVGCVDPDIEIK
jgi:hypothetical protein